MTASSFEDGRSADKRSSRALPWILFSAVVALTAVVFVLRWNSIDDDRRLIRQLSTTAFVDEVDDVASRLDLEQQKLGFLIDGAAAAMASGSGQSELAAFVELLPIDDRIPAISMVAIVEVDGDTGVVVAATSGSGAALDEHLGRTVGGGHLGEAFIDSAEASEARVGAFDLAGTGQFGLTRPIPGSEDRSLLVTFADSVFLSPALAGGGEIVSVLVPPAPSEPITTDDVDSQLLGTTDGTLQVVDDQLRWSGTVDVFGDDWALFVESAPDHLRVPDTTEHFLIGALGLMVAGLVLFFMRHRQRRAEADADVARTIQQSNRRFSTGFDNAPIGMAILDASGRVIRANRTMASLLGFQTDQIETQRLRDLVDEADSEEQREMAMALSRGDAASVQSDLRYVRPDGSIVWASQSISALNRRTDPERQFLVQALDMTASRAAAAELRHQALHDELTGLPNRTHLLEHAAVELADAHDTGQGVSLMFIDIDRFKVVNDSLGHGSGDEVLQILADRLRVATDNDHFLARFGGDEFVVVCPGVTDRERLSGIASVIHREVGRQIDLDDNPMHVAASIGVAVASARDTPESLLRDADAAMYRAKELGRGRTEFFEADIRAAAVNRLDLEQRLRQAIDRDDFGVHYQPVVDLKTGHVVGFEALLRWDHPELGPLSPADFLGVAEEAGLLDDIDRLTLGRACRQFALWSETSELAAGWHLAVNCSSRWFHDGVISGILLGLLADSSLDPSRLWLEVTENALLRDTRATAASFDDLHALGVKVAIDDFGTGFSSLSYLSQFNVDRLKIDQSFIQSLGTRADNAIVAAVVEMAGALGISSVAEGTESAEQLRILRELGADFAQGYLLSRPLTADQVENALINMV